MLSPRLCLPTGTSGKFFKLRYLLNRQPVTPLLKCDILARLANVRLLWTGGYMMAQVP